MAIQLWQQILLSDPKNAEALSGLAKDYKLIGSSAEADKALERMRQANPNDPNIGKIAGLTSTKVQSDRLRQAGELARQGKAEAAMAIYRELYGDRPPDGDIALAYYQTMYGTPLGKETAVTAMRALAQRNPGDTRFAVELGRMLTYEAKTRSEGIRILKEHPKDSIAQAALRQALVWDAANPSSAAELRAYLKDHPQDTEISGHLKENEGKLAQMNSGIARTPAERAAFAALNAHKLEEAQTRFTEILQQEPKNGRAAAGMGFLRMQQSNFGGAISYLTQAEQNGYKDRAVEQALVTSRFWYTMGEASQAFDENQLDVAQAKYRVALAMRPNSREALNGLAGLLTKEQQYTAAAGVYEQLLKVQPGSADAWRGLFLAYARDGQNQKAIAVSGRFPVPVKAALAKDPEYLRTLATIYHAENRPEDAQRVLAQALSLPFSNSGTNLKADTRLQYAGILMEAKHFDQAAELYTQILNEDPTNLPAWMGMVSAHHELARDNEAIADVEKMPPATYEAALADPGFLSMLGSIYAQANQFEIAQGLLERSAKLQIAAGGQPGVPLQLQVAAIYLQQNNTARAYEIYRQVLLTHPDRVDAWKGLISTLLATNRNTEALAQIAQLPPALRKQLETDIEFVQSEASLYAALGDTAHAIEYMNLVQAHYSTLKIAPPANIEVQSAWLLFNTKNDRALYPALMRLGSRPDLTAKQREAIQSIWANWSVRRAGAAMDNNNIQRAVDILDAASQAFPDNLDVRKAVAGGYVRVGRAKEALSLFKAIPMQDATAGDFQGAIGAALAANDKTQAEIWLRQALDRYPRNPAILQLAARFEQARGDNQRAADYYRASLAALPQASPADRLAHALVYPEQDTKARRAVTAADLQQLLDPNYEPFAKTTKVAPLPAYGNDPYNPGAPIVLKQGQQTLQQSQPQLGQWSSPAAAAPAPSTAVSEPAITTLPESRVTEPSPQLDRKSARASKNKIGQRTYEGSMHLPAGGNISSPPPVSSRPTDQSGQSTQQGWVPQAGVAQALSGQQAGSQLALGAAPVTHSLTDDAWKGLIFSLQSNNRTAEALQEIAKIPPEVRQELEGDVEFVQAEASVYAASGDIPHATEYMNRVENYYLLRRVQPPAGIAVQDAWLLYNTGNDHGLYPVLLRLDSRQDLTTEQRQQVQMIWVNWSLRRATAAMDSGNIQGAVDILDAASEQFPDNPSVRRAVAGGYARVGRASDALAIFKALPMQDASAGDLQGAIGAALAAKDMHQAETWLRQALAAFPSDPGILSIAARFEQARGNNERATDFWRASIAAMPRGQSARRLDSLPVYPQDETGVRRDRTPGDLKRLLDPGNLAQPAIKQPILPAYGKGSYGGSTPGLMTQPLPTAPPSQPWSGGPSGALSAPNSPLPVPTLSDSAARPATRAQSTEGSSGPAFMPQGAKPGMTGSQPTFIEQSATQAPDLKPATGRSQNGKQVRQGSKGKESSSTGGYTGKVNLPAAEETIGSTEPVPSNGTEQSQRADPAWTPQSGSSRSSNPSGRLRITSEPVEPLAAQVQSLFAEQTDSQLTQGSTAAVHTLADAPVMPSPTPMPSYGRSPSNPGQYDTAQYTPSAQEAATGAYSAPKQQSTQQPQPAPLQQAQPAEQPATTPKKLSKKGRKAAAAASRQSSREPSPTLESAPPAQNPQTMPIPELPSDTAPAQTPAGSGTGLSDEELQQRNLPPLRGPWVRVQREQRTTSPRDEAEMQLRSIESGYSPWLGGSGIINYRSGSLGFDHLSALEAPFEISFPAGYGARFTIVAKPVFLDSGQADGNAVMQVTTLSQAKLSQIPQPLGTLLTTDTIPPPQQSASGVGGELQLAFQHMALAAGYTPAGLLVANVTGRIQWKPGNGPFTLNFVRDSVRDTQLSYGGLRDPGSASLSFPGNIWGGVIANQGGAQYARGDAESGFYFGASGQYITGFNVEKNTRFDGSGGAYWRLLTSPENGNLSIGVNFFAMHYAHNEQAFTYGMGGYFSPKAYFLGNVPFTWAGHSGTKWHYNIMGSLGVQAFQQELAPLFPLAGQKSLEVSSGNLALPALTSVGPNYDLRGQVAYAIGPHWFAGGFLSANNSRNYSAVSAGFYVRYLFRSQPSTVTSPTGLFPTEGLRPFTVP
jgi:tetratricopeptide (TPR) repeat protein